jgi:hypothetical protein
MGVAALGAEWSHSLKGPDLFGEVESYAVASDSTGRGDLLVIRCAGKDTLELALLEPSTPSQVNATAKLAVLTVRMFFKIDVC